MLLINVYPYLKLQRVTDWLSDKLWHTSRCLIPLNLILELKLLISNLQIIFIKLVLARK